MSKIKAPDLSMAKIGDLLWDSMTGEWPRIVGISPTNSFQIQLSDGNFCNFYGYWDLPFSRYYWQPFAIPEECLTRPADPFPPEGTIGWGRVSLDGVWMIGYFIHDEGELFLSQDPNGMEGFSLPIVEFTIKDPYLKEAK